MITSAEQSSGGPFFLVLHPLADKTWAADNAKCLILAPNQVQQCRTVQFFQSREVEKRPQLAVGSGLNQLIKIRKMSMKKFSSDANRDGGIVRVGDGIP